MVMQYVEYSSDADRKLSPDVYSQPLYRSIHGQVSLNITVEQNLVDNSHLELTLLLVFLNNKTK